MNIAVLSGISRSSGGLFYAVRALCRALHQEKVTLQVYGAVSEWSDDDLRSWSPIPVRGYTAYGPLQSSRVLRHWLSKANVDLVHRHGIWTDPQWAALQWHKKTGRPFMLSPHGMLDPWAVAHSAWKKKIAGALFANEALRKASCIHALCESEIKSIRAYGLKNPVACIPNGINLPELVAAKNRMPENKKQLLFLGRIHPKKGIAELLKAWAMLPASRKEEWELLIAGWDDGGHAPGLKALADTLGISASVSFLGPQFGDEKEALLRSVNAFILPSFSEGLPMSVLEAWAYGVPVLMTEFCNIPDGFSVGAAIRIKPEPHSILDGLENLAASTAAELESIGLKGRKLVEEKFTWSIIAADMKAVYEWCLGGGSAPACVMEDWHGH